MPFAWKDFLLVARHLEQIGVNHTNEEAFSRSAISRAYYAAFCHARNHARDHANLELRGTDQDHYLVKDHYKHRRASGIASKLDQLRQWRNKCDYEDAAGDVSRTLEAAFRQAESIISYLK